MLNDLLTHNVAWSKQRHAEEPDHFACLTALQAPEFFRIGCSDSRVPANVVAGLDPGEVFVHRNAANIVHFSDMNLLSVLESAVDAVDLGRESGLEARCDRLTEWSVIEGVRRVCETPILQRAWARGTIVRVHGLIYGLNLRDLDCSFGPGHFQTIHSTQEAAQ
ncbi:MAG: carbonic anhydrase [Alphaproteobacteria bacterium]|nr:carbonic anhydrase [Alphaproteobacteria bacterium]MBU1281317.1 carbonic anhydrase [Alphaproteobacteria bacterium]MBU1829067.1 carbonic anhydrase [Alphaproteobacteria bacterium]MBU2243580.1 carbonic anhydrase [Alphaproteobacteria bacterium]